MDPVLEGRVAPFVQELMKTLESIHKLGIIHLDLRVTFLINLSRIKIIAGNYLHWFSVVRNQRRPATSPRQWSATSNRQSCSPKWLLVGQTDHVRQEDNEHGRIARVCKSRGRQRRAGDDTGGYVECWSAGLCAVSFWKIWYFQNFRLSGKSPFHGDNDEQTLANVRDNIPIVAPMELPGISDQAKRFVNTCLVTDPRLVRVIL